MLLNFRGTGGAGGGKGDPAMITIIGLFLLAAILALIGDPPEVPRKSKY
jgi:hypothetical protein